MKIEDVIKLVRVYFENEIDAVAFGRTFQAPYQNTFATIRELTEADYFELTFFKSDRPLDKLHDDYMDVGITFYPKSIEKVKSILDSIDA